MADPLWQAAGAARPLDLFGLGQISLDRVAVVERLPAPGGKATLRRQRELPGGQLATALLAASRLGLRCALAGAVGDDADAEPALAPLRDAGVQLDDVARLAGARTRAAWVLVESESGERTILEQRDPALCLAPDHLAEVRLSMARALLVDLEHAHASRQAAARARRLGIPVVLDADRASEVAVQLAREVDFPIVSRGFAEEMSSDASLEKGLRSLSGPHTRMAVVTCGAQGSLALLDGQWLRTPAARVPVVDTTGAGDVFRGAFAWALLRGWDARRVLRAANLAAGLSCRGEGAQGALPGRDELVASLEGGEPWGA